MDSLESRVLWVPTREALFNRHGIIVDIHPIMINVIQPTQTLELMVLCRDCSMLAGRPKRAWLSVSGREEMRER